MIRTVVIIVALLSCLALNAFANTIQTAKNVTISAPYTDRLTAGETTIYYHVTTPSTGYVTLNFRHANLNGSQPWNVKLVDAQGNEFMAFYSLGTDTSLTKSIGLPAGTYYVKISGNPAADYPYSTAPYQDNDYQLTVTQVAGNYEVEFNETTATATPISLGTAYTGNLENRTAGTDVDYYKVVTPSTGYVTVNFQHTSMDGDGKWNIKLVDAVGNEFMGFDSTGTDTNLTKNIGLPAGTYYVRINGASGWYSGSTPYLGNDYQIKITQAAGKTEIEYNESVATATPIDLGTAYTGNLENRTAGTDADYYKLVTTSTGYVTVNFQHVSLGGDGQWNIKLVDAQGNEFMAFNSTGTSTSLTKNIGLPAGTYYVKISGVSGWYNGSIPYLGNDYQITATQAAGKTEIESNDTVATATPIALGNAYTGNLENRTAGTDVDYYKFVTPSSGNATINFKHVSLSGDGQWNINLVDAQGNVLSSFNSKGTDTNLNQSLNLSAGTYYVKISGVSGWYNGSIPYLENDYNLTVSPDLTAPVVNLFTIPATATTRTVPVPSFTATDNVAVTGYLLTETSTTPGASDAGWSATALANYTFTGTIPQGVALAKTLFAWAKDAAGNVSTGSSASITITLPDTTKPTVDAFTAQASVVTTTIPVSAFSASDNIAVTGYLITQSATVPLAIAVGWSATAPANYTVTGTFLQAVPMVKTLFAWAKDAAGNVSTGSSASITITLPDTTKPTVDAFTAPASVVTTTIPVSAFSASDNITITGYLITESATTPLATSVNWNSTAPASYTVTGSISQDVPTTKTLFAWAKDAAGNVSTSRSATVTITLTGPRLTFSAATLANGTSTKNPTLNLTGSVTGTGSVVQSLTISLNGASPVTVIIDGGTGAFSTAIVLANGANTLATVATDTANSATTDTRVITLDPNLADLTLTTPMDASFIKDTFVTVMGSVGAPQSTTVALALNGAPPVALDLSGDNFSSTANLSSGLNTIVITATDSINGVHTKTLSVTSDGTLPSLSVTAPSDAFATAKSSVTLSGSVTDLVTTPLVAVTVNGVALASQPVLVADGSFSVTIPLPTAANYAIVVTATDQSGNSSTVQRNVIRTYPSGNAADGVSAPTISDALKVLQFALGGATPSVDEMINVDVAPLVNGKPVPNGVVDGGDALVILEKIMGTVAW